MENEKPILGYMSPSDEDLEKKREDISNRRALMAGATPLLVGLISGNTGDALEIASKGLMQEDQRKQEEDKTLLSYLRKRSMASEKEPEPMKRYSYTNIEKDGKTIKAKVDAVTGELTPTEHLTGYSPYFFTDPHTEEKGRVTKGLPDAKPTSVESVTPAGKVSLRFEKRANVIADKYTKDMESVRDIHQSLAEAQRLIHKKGQLPQKVAIQSIVKKVESGRVSNEDREYYTANVSKFQSLREAIDQERNSKVKARLVNEAKTVLKDLIDYGQKRIQGEALSRAKSFSKNKLEHDHLMKKLGAGQYMSPTENQKTTVTNGKETYEIDINDLGEAMRDGFEVVE